MPLMENSLTNSHPPSQPVCANQNLMHAKFHVNKYQDNLLSKRLKQLNNEEMKTRLKHQRTSNELVFFLRECQKSTGYYSKMNEFKGSKPEPLDSSSFCSNTNAKRPLTNKFRSTSISGCFPEVSPMKTRNDSIFSRRSIELDQESNKASLFIDALPSSSSTPNTPNSSSNNPSSVSKTSTSRSSNSSSAFSSNSSESLVVESVRKELNAKQIRPTIVRPLTAQHPKLFTKISAHKIMENKNANRGLNDSTTISNIDWYSPPVSLDLDMRSPNKLSFNAMPSQKPKKEAALCEETSKSNEFKSKSMNFPSYLGLSSTRKSQFSINGSSLDMTLSRLHTTRSGLNDAISSRNQTNRTAVNSRNSAIKINMSRSSIRKKQIEIMNEYNRYNTLELLNNLRQIQKNLDSKVKQFASNKLELDSKA